MVYLWDLSKTATIHIHIKPLLKIKYLVASMKRLFWTDVIEEDEKEELTGQSPKAYFTNR